MRNEYTDYIAHGHKYFAVVDLGKKNSKGTKLRRYFYSANEYKNYLAGKKTLDDKLMEGAAKAYKKVKGFATTTKTLPKLAKAIHDTNKEVKALKKSGLDEESARDEIRRKSAYQHMKRAGVEVTNDKGDQLEGKDKNGNKYRMDVDNREIRKAVHQTDPDYSKDQSKKLIGEQKKKEAEKSKYSNIFKNTVKKPNQVPAILKPAQKVGEIIDKTVGAKVRENFVERMVEKGINKAKAEKLRDTIKSTVGNATSIATSASNIKNRMDAIQDAILSGDGKALNDEMDRMLDDSDSLLDDMENVAKNLPIIGTFAKAMEEDEAKWEKERAERNAKLEKERAEREEEWNKKSAAHDAEMAKKQAAYEEAKKKIAEATDKIMSDRNDISVLVDSAKKTVDTAIAGPKDLTKEIEEFNKQYEEKKKKIANSRK